MNRLSSPSRAGIPNWSIDNWLKEKPFHEVIAHGILVNLYEVCALVTACHGVLVNLYEVGARLRPSS